MTSRPEKPPVHPGIHIRQSIILSAGLTVKKTAEMLGVGRPALSKLLNGRAALSPDMATRFEKAFKVDASALRQMQAQYDEGAARAREDDIAVRAHVTPYLQVTARQIAAWADTLDARGQLPALLHRLVHSTGTNLTAVDFPAFDNSQRKGWDGQVTSGSATPWISSGESGWEFGCDKRPQNKAETVYRARTAGVPAKLRKSTAFVFVTPRNWAGKNNWAKDKKTRDEWKDVRAFDASDLEQWLEQSIPAQIRMREFLGDPIQDVTTLCQIWREWAGDTEPELPKGLFVPATERHREEIEKWLKAHPTRPFVVAADSTLEALAFLSCALDRLRDSCPGAHDQAVVIRSLDGLKSITKSSSSFLAIVASSHVEKSLAGLHKKTHTIIVRGRSAVSTDADIALDLLGDAPFRKALRDSGLKDSLIDQLARESARSPTILRRRLAQIEAVKAPPWATDNIVARNLIPLMFVGVWDSNAEADKEILRFLTDNKPYDDVERTAAGLQTMDEPPVWSIDHFRGVFSKIDTLYAVHRLLTKKDLENFLFVAEVVLSEQDPALKLPEDKRWAANLYGKSRHHSSTLRRSLCDTLVLLAVHGNALVGDRLGIDLEAEVGNVVQGLLTPLATCTWLSQKNDLAQYAEAAPDKFLDIIEEDLRTQEPRLAVLFASADTGLFGDCPRAGMLWALELLAWKPERLVRVTTILARLCAWKIDDNWTSQPMATLKSIFRFWMPQTAASVAQRNQALERLARKFPVVGWQLCVDQFDPASIHGYFSHKPRWRTDAYDADEVATAGEARDGQHEAIALALKWSPHDEHTLGDLVERLDALSPDHREQVWRLIANWNDTGPTDRQKAALRERIRRYALTSRSWRRGVDDAAKKCARRAVALLEPRNPVVRYQWLFLTPWIEELEDEPVEQRDYQKQEESIARQRRDSLREVWARAGLDGVKDLCRFGEASHVVGIHMAEICTGVHKMANVLQNIMAEQSDDLRHKCEQCIKGFLAALERQERHAVLAEMLAHLGSDEDACIRLLRCAPFNNDTWQHVHGQGRKLKRRYWKEVNPDWGAHDTAAIATFVDELLKVDRPRAAFEFARVYWDRLDSTRLTRLLTEVATNRTEPADHYLLDRHYVSTALDTLEQRGDVSRRDLARLEFLFIPALRHSEHGIPNLNAQLSESPELFMQALALAFRRNDGGEDPAEWRLSNSDNRIATADAAHALLTIASRIPGTRSDGSIDLKKLKAWLEQVRSLACEYGRATVADHMIGQLLSHCPLGDDDIWPCEPVREALDDIGTQEVALGMLVGIRNARGATWRDKGGEPDRKLAEQYRSWSRKVADYPFIARMLEQIAASYDKDAKFWDDQGRVRQRLSY